MAYILQGANLHHNQLIGCILHKASRDHDARTAFIAVFSKQKDFCRVYLLWEIQHAPRLDNMAGNIAEVAKRGCLMKSTVLIAAAITITTMCSIQPVRGEEKAVVFYDTDQRQLMASLNMGDMAVKDLVYVVSRLTGENFVINGEVVPLRTEATAK